MDPLNDWHALPWAKYAVHLEPEGYKLVRDGALCYFCAKVFKFKFQPYTIDELLKGENETVFVLHAWKC